MKRILTIILIMTMILSVSIFAETEEPSEWAKEFVNNVSEQNILKEEFFKGFTNNITRGEFAYLGVKLYEQYTGKEATVGDATFTDTSDEWALKAKNTGIVGGYPDGTFLPDKEITREELAVLFVNTFNSSSVKYLPADEAKFTDDDKISSWAKNAVYIAKRNGIVNGVGENIFDSQGKATKEQSLIMFNKGQTSTELVNTNQLVGSNGPVGDNGQFDISSYSVIVVDGGNLSGHREAKVVVDIGYGDREYYAYTNEYGQLFRVTAKEIILQDDSTEPVLSTGRYYYDEAKVPGVESPTLDEGHVIADSLGGVSNAYNITPQNSTLNRYGDQAYMEKVIRDAGGCTDFVAIITYPNTTTQIPSHYSFTYTLNGNVINDEFDNVNPDEVNAELEEPIIKPVIVPDVEDISNIDTNNNEIVTIAEAIAAGFKMPITSDHWLYKYMIDRDGDGMVGE